MMYTRMIVISALLAAMVYAAPVQMDGKPFLAPSTIDIAIFPQDVSILTDPADVPTHRQTSKEGQSVRLRRHPLQLLFGQL